MAEFDCEETKKHVHEFLHNELSVAEIRDITVHLANCDSCEGDYDVENVLNNAISRACADVPPQELADSIMNRVRDIQNGVAH
jgi:anti-sigma factor (TIGR02949 family)